MNKQQGNTSIENSSDEQISIQLKKMVSSLLNKTITDSIETLSDWQWSKVAEAGSESEVRCQLKQWFGFVEQSEDGGLFCNTMWDHIYCWPPTLAGSALKLPCVEVFGGLDLDYQQLKGHATRKCLSNGTWSRGKKVIYSECLASMVSPENADLIRFVRYAVFYGSIASLVFLILAMTIFFLFRKVWSERMKVHVHLMISLILRYVVYLIVTSHHVLEIENNYRESSFTCKSVLVAHLFATIASVYWMLAQGLYINGKLSTNVFPTESNKKFKRYYIIGWVLPMVLMAIYVIVMVANEYPGYCWKGYAEATEMWIILLPTQVAIVINGLVLLNVLRIVLTKAKRTREQTEFSKLISIAKVTIFLFPILGLNNLFFLYIPKDKYNTLFVSVNTIFASTQGILVAIVYCFNCSEVHEAIRRSFNRIKVKRSVRNESSSRLNASVCMSQSNGRCRPHDVNVEDRVAEDSV